MGTELFHNDRRMGVTTLIVAFRNFANAPKMTKQYELLIHKLHTKSRDNCSLYNTINISAFVAVVLGPTVMVAAF